MRLLSIECFTFVWCIHTLYILDSNNERGCKLIISFKSQQLEHFWTTGDDSAFDFVVKDEIRKILDLLDMSISVKDFSEFADFKVEEYELDHWAASITVNNVEPVGSITFKFYQENAHDVNYHLCN